MLFSGEATRQGRVYGLDRASVGGASLCADVSACRCVAWGVSDFIGVVWYR